MDTQYHETSGGKIPRGLPGGFFIYEAEEDEKILFAEDNIVKLYGCDDFEDFLSYTKGSFNRIITKQGEERYIEDFGHLLHERNGNSFFYVFIVDVDQNEFYNKNRNSLAEAEILSANNDTDPLTGLFTMSVFYHRIQMLMSSPEGRRREAAFIHFDIPNFKLYNERHGFKLGDELLCDLAEAILESFPGGTVARFSDDHFVVYAYGNRDEVTASVEKVYKKMLLADDVNKKVRIKAGIFIPDDRFSEVGLACDHARLACNSIKNRHDINYCIYDEMLRDQLRKQQYVSDHIDEAIEKEYIKVYYQPVIRVKSGEICGYEALVRWVDPKIGMLSPADFIDTLEQFHLIHLLDAYVVRKACEDYKNLISRGEAVVPVSVNISRLDFELCDICAIIEETRQKFNVPRNMLDLEITESALNSNAAFIKEECDKMRELGYHIWIDDFGSGYSSLNTVAEFNFDVLKLDLVFLRSYDRNPKTASLMTYIVEGAKAMGVAPLCEGVEKQEHFAFLKKIGCERAQGYYFGKPMPMEEMRKAAEEKGMKWEKIACAFP